MNKKIPQELINQYENAKKDINNYIEDLELIGKELIWAVNKYKGRKAVITDTLYWPDSIHHPHEIMVRVKTENKSGGFLYDNDSFHRQYRYLNLEFEEVNNGT